MEKRAFFRSIAAYQVPGDVLFGLSNETTSSIAAAIGVTAYLSFDNCHSPKSICLCTGQVGGLNEDVNQLLDCGTDCYNPSKNVDLILIYYFF